MVFILFYSENRGNSLDHSVTADHNLRLFRGPKKFSKSEKSVAENHPKHNIELI